MGSNLWVETLREAERNLERQKGFLLTGLLKLFPIARCDRSKATEKRGERQEEEDEKGRE